jgi:hypothetical protein
LRLAGHLRLIACSIEAKEPPMGRVARTSVEHHVCDRARLAHSHRLVYELLERRLLFSAQPADSYQQPNAAWFDQVAPELAVANGDSVDRWIVRLTEPAVARASTVAATAALLGTPDFPMQVVRGLGLPGLVEVDTRGANASAVSDYFDSLSTVAYSSNDETLIGESLPTGSSAEAMPEGPRPLPAVLTTGGVAVPADAQPASGVVIAELDSGIDYSTAGNSSLQADIWTGTDPYGSGVHGHDFVNNSDSPLDDSASGHGTEVAGILAAAQSGGPVGAQVNVNLQASIMSVKVLDANNNGTALEAIEGIDYAVLEKTSYNVPVDIINASWNIPQYDQGLYDAISAAGAAGILFVTAAGNGNTLNQGLDLDSAGTAEFPANFHLANTLTVAATNADGSLAAFSNYGAGTVDVAAPGVGIPTIGASDAAVTENGTSMAAPLVSRVAAAVLAEHPGASPSEVKNAIMSGADMSVPLVGADGEAAVHTGELDAAGALTATTFAPSARLASIVDPTPSSPFFAFTVTYTGLAAINSDSFSADNVSVVRDGSTSGGSLASGDLLLSGQPSQITYLPPVPDTSTAVLVNGTTQYTQYNVTYDYSVPGGTLSAVDNGTYQLDLIANQVFDYNGLAANGQTLINSDGSTVAFAVDISDSTVYAVNTTLDLPALDPVGGPACDPQGDISLRSAIEAANAAGAPRTIVLSDGDYALTSGLSITGNMTVLGDEPAYTSFTTPTYTTVSGGGPLTALFEVSSGAVLGLDGILLTGSNSPAIDNSGTVSLARCTVSGIVGTGILNAQSDPSASLMINESSISNNVEGGIFSSGGSIQIMNSLLSGNGSAAVGFGGAIYSNGTLSLTNCTVSGNSAGEAGGIGIGGGSATIESCTITDNVATNGSAGGLAAVGSGAVTIHNSAVAGNTAKDSINPDIVSANPVLSEGYNFIGVAGPLVSGFSYPDLFGFFYSPLDPMLAPLANNGGATASQVPQAGSQLINTGDPINFQPRDQIGDPRPQTVDTSNMTSQAEPDIGAVERSKTTVSGRIFADYNGNGVLDANEPGLAGWTVTIYRHDDASGKFVYAGQTTSAVDDPTTPLTVETGDYSFVEGAGNYVLSISPPAGYTITNPSGIESTSPLTVQPLLDSGVGDDGVIFDSFSSTSGPSIDGGNVAFDAALGGTDSVWQDVGEQLTSLGQYTPTSDTTFENGVVSFIDNATALRAPNLQPPFVISAASGDTLVSGQTFDSQQKGVTQIIDEAIEKSTNGGPDLIDVIDGSIPVDTIPGMTDAEELAIGDGGGIYVIGNDNSAIFRSNSNSNNFQQILAAPADYPDVILEGGFSELVAGDNNVGFVADYQDYLGKPGTGIFLTGDDGTTIDEVVTTSTALPNSTDTFVSFQKVALGTDYVVFQATGSGGEQGIYAAVRDDEGNWTVVTIADLTSIGVDPAQDGSPPISFNLGRDAVDGGEVVFEVNFANGQSALWTANFAPVYRIYEDLIIGTAPQNVDFAAQPQTNTLSGTVTDQSGSPQANVTVYIDGHHSGIYVTGDPTAVTDSNGVYTFSNLLPGTYTLHEVAPTNYVQTAPSSAAGFAWTVTLTVAESLNAFNFSNALTPPTVGQGFSGTLGGIVFSDANGDRVQDDGELGLQGVTVYLDNNNDGQFDNGEPSQTTGSDGSYSFTGLLPGSYHVRAVEPTGYSTSSPIGNALTQQPTLSTGVSPEAPALGDLRGIGLPDLVIPNLTSNTVTIGLDNGAGQITSTRTLAFPQGSEPVAAVVGKFKGGSQSIAVVTEINTFQPELISYANGNFIAAPATITNSSGTPVSLPAGSSELVVGDFNHDNLPDLAIINAYAPYSLSILLDNPQDPGTFILNQTLPLSQLPADIVALNLTDDNHDGEFTSADKLGLAILNAGNSGKAIDNSLTLLTNDGSGTFTAMHNLDLGSPTANSVSLATADFNADGIPDLAVSNFGTSTITTLFGSRSGNSVAFAPSGEATYPVPKGNTSLVAADVNGDGLADLVVSSVSGTTTLAPEASILRNKGDGTFAAAESTGGSGYLGVEASFVSIAVGNFKPGSSGQEPSIVVASASQQAGTDNIQDQSSGTLSIYSNSLISGDQSVMLDSGQSTVASLDFGMLEPQAPTSNVAALPAFSTASFAVSWAGTASGASSIASYSVYVSDNGGAFAPFLLNTTQTSAIFTGVNGHTYGFYSVATDSQGLVQATPAAAQATTRVDAVAPVSSISTASARTSLTNLAISWSGTDNSGGSGIAGYDISVATDGAAAVPWLTGTTQTSGTFAAQLGHTYGFYCVAIDQAGNAETDAAPDATITTTSQPWQNPADNLDVNQDGLISSLDALVVINYLNANAAALGSPLPDTAVLPLNFIDVDGNGFAAPLDALQIINYLNAHPLGSAVAATGAAPASDALVTAIVGSALQAAPAAATGSGASVSPSSLSSSSQMSGAMSFARVNAALPSAIGLGRAALTATRAIAVADRPAGPSAGRTAAVDAVLANSAGWLT